RLDEHRGAHVVAALHIGEQLVEQIALVGNARGAQIPEVMVWIADGQLGLQRLLLGQGEPVIASEGHGGTSVDSEDGQGALGWVRARAESSHAGGPSPVSPARVIGSRPLARSARLVDTSDRTTSRTSRVRTRSGTRMTDMAFMVNDGFRLYYEDTGGAGPVLLFLHGAGGNHLSWWQQVPVFAEQYRCITADQRGFGRSPDVPGGPGPAALATDALALLDHLGIGRAALVAQSMGGWAAVGAAVRAPGRFWAIALATTVAPLPDPGIAPLRQRLAAASPPRPPVLWHAALGPTFRKAEPVRSFLYAEIAALNAPLAPDFRDALG